MGIDYAEDFLQILVGVHWTDKWYCLVHTTSTGTLGIDFTDDRPPATTSIKSLLGGSTLIRKTSNTITLPEIHGTPPFPTDVYFVLNSSDYNPDDNIESRINGYRVSAFFLTEAAALDYIAGSAVLFIYIDYNPPFPGNRFQIQNYDFKAIVEVSLTKKMKTLFSVDVDRVADQSDPAIRVSLYDHKQLPKNGYNFTGGAYDTVFPAGTEAKEYPIRGILHSKTDAELFAEE